MTSTGTSSSTTTADRETGAGATTRPSQPRASTPSCGDEIQLSVAIIDGAVGGLGFGGSGCSISQSSASMMTEALTGRTLDSAREMSKHVQQMLTDDTFDLDAVDLGDLEALSGVAKFPVRIKCGLLAWKVLDQALANASGESVDDDSDIPTRVTSS